jgi:hypothetical protein
MNISTLGWLRVLGFGDGGIELKSTNASAKALAYEGKIKL